MPKTDGTCRDILKRREALWTFVQVDGVEPTNNTAERSIRPGVLWRKGSFGTQSEEGSRFVESMLTVVTTLKQQQRNVLEYLTAACEAALRGGSGSVSASRKRSEGASCGVSPVFITRTVTWRAGSRSSCAPNTRANLDSERLTAACWAPHGSCSSGARC